jgi:insertion element IS1 protein InsB
VKKKGSQLHRINHVAINQWHHEDVHVSIEKVEAVEVDAMWSDVGNKTQQRWLWHAIDHRTGVILADVLGQRQDEVF